MSVLQMVTVRSLFFPVMPSGLQSALQAAHGQQQRRTRFASVQGCSESYNMYCFIWFCRLAEDVSGAFEIRAECPPTASMLMENV